MGFLVASWRRIGARLYLALGFSVLLVVLSSGVGVYYFEQSISFSEQVRLLNLPSQDASWEVSREVDRLRLIGLGLLAGSGPELDAGGVTSSIDRLEAALSRVSGSPDLVSHREVVQEDFYRLVHVIDGLLLYGERASSLGLDEAAIQDRMLALSPDQQAVLSRGLSAATMAELDSVWPLMSVLVEGGVDPELVRHVYRVRAERMALDVRGEEHAAALADRGSILELSVTALVVMASRDSSNMLASSVDAFDRGRIILTGVSILGVVASTLVAWFWVGQGVVRRLSLLSERMRGMALGDIDTPMPGIRGDEIGELAGALEVWRQQSIEVRRLNLVEQLYGELREAHEELQLMQDRLVAQEKLAALGELVSGVAHEISNPLNFVQNFSNVSSELCGELNEMIEGYREGMSEEDRSYLDEITSDLRDSIDRIQNNGSRALDIVARMRDLGGGSGEPEPAELNSVVRHSVDGACRSFCSDWDGFEIQVVFDLDSQAGQVPLVVPEFSKAVGNLALNACYAMWLRARRDEGYSPELRVSTSRAEGRVLVRVLDNGTGISPDIIEQIFNPFFTTREGALGAGLGLPIAQDVLRRLGGHLTVESLEGSHSEFLMDVPLG